MVASPPGKQTMVEGDKDKLAVEIDESQRMGCTSMDPSQEPVKSMGLEAKLKEIDQAIFGEWEPTGPGENFQNLAVVSDFKRQQKAVNQRILEMYEGASGQQLNREKTSLFFSCNTPSDVQEEIKIRFGAQIIKQREKYLGLSSLVGKSRRSTFKVLKERVANKLSGGKRNYCQ